MPPENEDVLQKLAPSIVEIVADKEGEDHSTTLGTGFVITDDGLVVTCRHVVTDSEDRLMNRVCARFYFDFVKATSHSKDVNIDNLPKYNMNLAKEYTQDPSTDLAFYKFGEVLSSLQNKKLAPVALDEKVVSSNDFATIGFKKAHMFRGLSAYGTIGILTRKESKDGLLSPEVIELHHNKKIQPGMSGAPVFDRNRNRVVGIITERYTPIDYADEEFALALPVKAMIELSPILREKNQGLTLLSKFLRAIGEEGSSIYKLIDEVYVPPLEYEDIKKSLKSKRIVFITGTKEFGKTFTAVRLMYEFFKEAGYQPRWVHERKEQGGPEGADPQELARIREEEGYIKPHQIVYFEDPFGKSEYKRSTDLESYIGSIISSIKRVQDAYVIITSREEVFKDFVRNKIKSVDLADFEKKMNLKSASYDTERRKEMLLKWAKVNNCRWLFDPASTDLVVAAIENQGLLPTPLNIKDFILASHNNLDNKQLEELMEQVSEETAGRFADEIMMMEEDEKVIFLAFPYVSTLAVDLVKKMYETIIAARPNSDQKYCMDFDRVKNWFEGDKINISEHKIEFSHPSYHEAFEYGIGSEKVGSQRIRDILVEVLLRLVDNDEAVRGVAHIIADNFNNLPPHVQQLLFKLVENDKAAYQIASEIAINFDNLPPNIREQLLLKLADKDSAAWYVVDEVVHNYNNLPSNLQQLLFKLADNEKTAFEVASAIYENFVILPPNIREQLLMKLAYKDSPLEYVASIIARNFDKLPPNVQELVFKLADIEKAAVIVAREIGYSFDNLPSTMLEQLLLKLVNKYRTRKIVSDVINDNSNKIPDNIRKEILAKVKKINKKRRSTKK